MPLWRGEASETTHKAQGGCYCTVFRDETLWYLVVLPVLNWQYISCSVKSLRQPQVKRVIHLKNQCPYNLWQDWKPTSVS